MFKRMSLQMRVVFPVMLVLIVICVTLTVGIYNASKAEIVSFRERYLNFPRKPDTISLSNTTQQKVGAKLTTQKTITNLLHLYLPDKHGRYC